MAQRQRNNASDEPELFDEADELLPEELDDYEIESDVERTHQLMLAEEPLFTVLLRQAVRKLWPDDAVVADFVDHVAGRLSTYLAVQGAKGGDFYVQRAQAGLKVNDDYRQDQSLRAHLVNGLFPVLHIVHQLKTWGIPRLRRLNDGVKRIFVAGYVLHDWVKLPQVEDELQTVWLSYDTVNANQHLPLIEEIFLRWCERLGLDVFLKDVGGSEAVLHDLIFVASNTQVKWGTLHNLSALHKLSMDGRALDLCERLILLC
jgi:CRISPR-associated protein Csc3